MYECESIHMTPSNRLSKLKRGVRKTQNTPWCYVLQIRIHETHVSL